MGRLFAAILFLSACADNLIEPPQPGSPGGQIDEGTGAPPTAQRFRPEVCGVRQWTTAIAADPLMDISVVASVSQAGAPTGATLLAVPRAGGPMTGFALDDRMDIAGNKAGTKIQIDEAFFAVSASIAAGELVSAAVDKTNGSVRMDVLAPDLTKSAGQVAKLPGNFVGEPAVLYANGERLVPVASDAGLTVHAFDNSWGWLASKDFATAKPAMGLATTQMGSKAMVAWTTGADCSVRMLTGVDTGNGSTMSSPCMGPRLAASNANDASILVYQTPEGVRYADIAHGVFHPPTQLIRADATSPRALWDGQRYWVSYLDVRGDVVVGFIYQNKLISMGLPGTTPKDSAYELAIVNGSPWVFSLDASGYSAQRLCVNAVW